jgi:hypothetical protein
MMAPLPYRTSLKVAFLALTLGRAAVGHKGVLEWWDRYRLLMVADYCFERLRVVI